MHALPKELVLARAESCDEAGAHGEAQHVALLQMKGASELILGACGKLVLVLAEQCSTSSATSLRPSRW